MWVDLDKLCDPLNVPNTLHVTYSSSIQDLSRSKSVVGRLTVVDLLVELHVEYIYISRFDPIVSYVRQCLNANTPGPKSYAAKGGTSML